MRSSAVAAVHIGIMIFAVGRLCLIGVPLIGAFFIGSGSLGCLRGFKRSCGLSSGTCFNGSDRLGGACDILICDRFVFGSVVFVLVLKLIKLILQIV